MVRPINSPAIPHPPHRQPSLPVSSPSTQEAGKPSQHAVGQQAKVAISQAVQGEELPKNIQGKVASALARGLSLDTIINLQEPTEPVVGADPTTDVPVEPVADDVVAEDPVIEDSVVDASQDSPVLTEPTGEPALDADPIELSVTEAPVLESGLTDLLPDDEDSEII